MFEKLEKISDSKTEKIESTIEEELIETYQGSEILKMLKTQTERSEDGTALFTDIDNTFYRKEKAAAARKLTEKSQTEKYPLIAITGNGYTGVLERIKSGELPSYQVIAGLVGTEIWVLHKDKEGNNIYKKDEFFSKKLKESGFNRESLGPIALKMVEEFNQNHPQWKFNFQDPLKEKELLEKSDPNYQPFKISFYFFAGSQDLEKVEDQISKRFPGQALVICEEVKYNQNLPNDAAEKKYCLDILPIAKSGPVKYLGKLLNIKKGIVAGDSGNDIDMLLETGTLNSVLVGGYKPEAKTAIEKAVVTTKPGRRSFQKIVSPEGEIKAIYVEQKNLMAAESILRAAEILQRAEKIKQIRKTRNQI